MAKDDEKLDRSNLLRVISLLDGAKPITKKAACEILNITYNTTRLGKLITKFKEDEANNKRRRAERRGTPITTKEKTLIAQLYLADASLADISETIYRPTNLIKSAVLALNIPLRDADATYQKPHFIEDHAIKEDYVKDDLVYAARYGVAALVEKRYETKDGPIYCIYILGKEQCYATQPYWELADLTNLQKELGIIMKPTPGMPPSYNPKK